MARSRSPVSRMVCRLPASFDTFFELLTKEEQRAWRSLRDSSCDSLSQGGSSVVSVSAVQDVLPPKTAWHDRQVGLCK